VSEPFEKTSNGSMFSEVFTEVSHSEKLGLKNPEQLRIFHLNVIDNAFSFDRLEAFLRRNIGQYVFSRAQIEKYRIEGNAFSVGMDALDVMRRNGSPGQKGTGNDLGEIMLYVFLEQVLGAPKILSKVELQTGAKQYNSKCDGVHLLSLDASAGVPYYQMVFGTSSITGDMKDAIDDAFDAIMQIENQKTQERVLAENTVFSKDFDSDTVKKIKDLLIPEKGQPVPCDTAYGVFLVYDLGLDPSRYTALEFRSELTRKMQIDIVFNQGFIINKIKELKLENHSFYFYILPLNEAETEKTEIMERVINGGAMS